MLDDEYLRELFSSLGEISIRKMFGGQGIYYQGKIFAVVVDSELLLKANEETKSEFIKAGCVQWAYEGKNGRISKMPYWNIPSTAFDDADEMAHWAKIAVMAR